MSFSFGYKFYGFWIWDWVHPQDICDWDFSLFLNSHIQVVCCSGGSNNSVGPHSWWVGCFLLVKVCVECTGKLFNSNWQEHKVVFIWWVNLQFLQGIKGREGSYDNRQVLFKQEEGSKLDLYANYFLWSFLGTWIVIFVGLKFITSFLYCGRICGGYLKIYLRYHGSKFLMNFQH